MKNGGDMNEQKEQMDGMATQTLAPIVPQAPQTHRLNIHGLHLNLLSWGPKDRPGVLLIHGTKDHARSWDWTIAKLLPNYRVLALDLRGHGDSQWVPGGGYDHHDMIGDLAAVFDHIERTQLATLPLTLIGHSLGGNLALHFAVLFPAWVKGVIALEGLGVSQEMYDRLAAKPVGAHVREWVMRNLGKLHKSPSRFGDPEQAVARMAKVHQNLSPEQARHLALHGLRHYEDGWGWKHDPLLGFHFPTATAPKDYMRAFATITMPVLLMRGTKSWASDPEKDGRLSGFQNARLINYENAGHWLHHDAFEPFIDDVRDFLEQTI